jgi:hypothetical protein
VLSQYPILERLRSKSLIIMETRSKSLFTRMSTSSSVIFRQVRIFVPASDIINAWYESLLGHVIAPTLGQHRLYYLGFGLRTTRARFPVTPGTVILRQFHRHSKLRQRN